MITRICALLLLLAACSVLFAADPPQAHITNGAIDATLNLPDARNGYYRGTRFDWSGQIASLKYKGHEYFGKWFDKYDPLIHDAILGPVEEFLSDDAGLGYNETKPDESFVRIGVGAVRKPQEDGYKRFNTYEITNSGKWTVKPHKDRVEFTHELANTGGYAYSYKKTVRLAAGEKPQMVLEHTLHNKGSKPIETSVYNHNFYVIDGVPSGPEFTVKFPFDVKASRDLGGRAETVGNELRYLQELETGKSVFSELTGFGDAPRDYDIRVENRKSRAGVRQTSDRPMSKLIFWSIRTTVCPEAYIHMRIAPGESFSWKIVYDFYELP
ncbi:MAG: hypothetical protein ABI972_16435 [Acidobacteriota bacterium]